MKIAPTMNDANVPMDVTAMQAEAVVKAAIAWRYEKGHDPILSTYEWRLYDALNNYGDKFKGLRAN